MKQSKVKKVIVITGSIGTGKSTAVDIIKSLGFQVLDSDKIVHEGYNKGSELYCKVTEHFGKEILNDDGSINRQKLGKIVFSDAESLNELNRIVHAYVTDKLMNGVEECKDEVIFLDIPLILERLAQEKEYGLKFDEIWLVYVNPETQIERLRQRAIKENKNPDDVLNIIKKQIPIDKKVSMADEVIDNEGTVKELEVKIRKLLKIKDIGW
ncbi:MAG TPA: dephospho-CoA kinase [Clostridiales bacterium]|nr:dephospho-CoA kinase [Clostridiales bacterium]